MTVNVASMHRRLTAVTAAAAVALALSACSPSGLNHGAPVLAAPAGATGLLSTIQGVVWSFQPDSGTSVILRGSDKGRHWQVVLSGQGAGAGLVASYFLGPGEAWAVTRQQAGGQSSRTVLATTNGGRHWFRGGALPGEASVPGYASYDQIYFADARHGWLLTGGVGPGGAGGRQRLALWSTTDGGHIWTEVPGRGLPLQNSPLAWTGTSQSGCQDKPTITFANPLAGWLTEGACGAPDASPRVWRTTDSGRTWTAVPLPGPAGGWSAWYGTGPHAGLHFPGTVRSGIEVGQARVVASGIGAYVLVPVALSPSRLLIYRSKDGGRTWQIAGRLHTAGQPGQGSPVSWFDPIDALDWVVNAPGRLIETADGGRHWAYIKSSAHLPGAAASFTKLSEGYAQGTGKVAVLVTRDSGRTWQAEP